MRFERWPRSTTSEPPAVARTLHELFTDFLFLIIAGRSFSIHDPDQIKFIRCAWYEDMIRSLRLRKRNTATLFPRRLGRDR